MTDDHLITQLRKNGWEFVTLASDDSGTDRKIVIQMEKRVEKPEAKRDK